jgi:TusA-related sulfurtransferase
MSNFILDLRSVKCPMNLVLVKQAVHDGSFANSGKIIVEDEVARGNILKYLEVRGLGFEVKGVVILVKSA